MLESVEGQIIGGHEDLLFLDVGSWVLQLKTTPSIAANLLKQIPVLQRFYLAFEWQAGSSPTLIAFPDRAVRELYLALLGINNVGPQIALNVLDGIEPIDLLRAIAAADYQFLTSLPKIGLKRAELLVLQMRGSKTVLPKPVPVPMSIWIPARSSLLHQGLSILEAEAILLKIADPSMSQEELIAKAASV